jgi:hypothetical protein
VVTLKKCQNKLQQLQWKEQGKEGDCIKDGEMSLKRIYIQHEKQIGNSQRPSGMKEDCTGSQGPQHTAAVEDEKICDTVIFNHHAILSPVVCTLPVQPNFMHNTQP